MRIEIVVSFYLEDESKLEARERVLSLLSRGWNGQILAGKERPYGGIRYEFADTIVHEEGKNAEV